MSDPTPPARTGFWGRAAYRIGQFGRRLWPRVSPADRATAAAVLTPAGMGLFLALSAGDQRHALCVLRQLRAEEPVEDALAQAALLHDAGKAGGGLTLPVRAAVVLLGATAPGRRWLERLGSPLSRWRRPFYVHGQHASIGADRCRAAGLDEITVALVRLHDTPPRQAPESLRPLLIRLQAADDRC